MCLWSRLINRSYSVRTATKLLALRALVGRRHLVQTALECVQLAAGSAVLVASMTFNVWLIGAGLLGCVLCFWLFEAPYAGCCGLLRDGGVCDRCGGSGGGARSQLR